MGLASVVRSAVATAKTVADDLLVPVTHRACTGEDAYRKRAYSAAVTRMALVEDEVRMVRTEYRGEVATRAKVTFLENVTIGAQDEIVLPDGSTGPILDIRGLADTAGGRFVVEVWLGSGA